ncbi:MAG: biopolymer transporter ExbD [Planctomycetota bacterium]|nr:biopolymer transporter ExbD [Planctomycetota bacterium]
MAKRKKYQSEVVLMELQMTPMIDVIFQLIIFFMCSIQFKSLEGKLLSYLPKDKGMMSTQVTDPILEEVRIKLTYSEGAHLKTRIKIGDKEFRIKIGDKEFPDWDALFNHMRTIAPNLLLPNGIDVIPVKIDSDEMIPTQSVVYALNICKKAGVQKTEFAAKTSPGRPKK